MNRTLILALSLIDTSGVKESITLTMRQTIEQVSMAISNITKDLAPVDVKALIAELQAAVTRDMDTLLLKTAQIWADNFTEQELEGLIAFYQSPLGRAMMTKMPIISAAGMKVGEEWALSLNAKVEKFLS